MEMSIFSKISLSTIFFMSTISFIFVILVAIDGTMSKDRLYDDVWGIWNTSLCYEYDKTGNQNYMNFNLGNIKTSQALSMVSTLSIFGALYLNFVYLSTKKIVSLFLLTILVSLSCIFYVPFMVTTSRRLSLRNETIADDAKVKLISIGGATKLGWVTFCLITLVAVILVHSSLRRLHHKEARSKQEGSIEANLYHLAVVLLLIASILQAITVTGKNFSKINNMDQGNRYIRWFGLWNYCTESFRFDSLTEPTINMNAARSVRAFAVLSVISSALGILMSAFHFATDRTSLVYSGVAFLLAGIFEAIALTIQTKYMMFYKTLEYGWAYKLGWSASAMFILNFILFLMPTAMKYQQFK